MTADTAMSATDDQSARFTAFVVATEPRLRRALVAAYGAEVGRDAAADALTWAWEHFERVEAMRNPGGYLYRVGQSAAKRSRRGHVSKDLRLVGPEREAGLAPEPGLSAALTELSPRQRTAVLLIDGWGCTQREAAETMGCRISTVRVHQRRGIARLRESLGADHEG